MQKYYIINETRGPLVYNLNFTLHLQHNSFSEKQWFICTNMHGWNHNNDLYGIFVASTIDITLNPNGPTAMVYLDHYNIEKVNKSYACTQSMSRQKTTHNIQSNLHGIKGI